MPDSRKLWLLFGLLVVLTLASIITPIWWWALVGMSERVTQAWTWTDLVVVPLLGLAAIATAFAADDAGKGQ